MSLGENLSETGKSDGLTRESVAETLGVSANEPVDYAPQLKEIERVIEKTDEKIQSKVDWTKVWSKKYPVLASYLDKVDVNLYVPELKRLLEDLETRYGYDRLDSFLVLKDILGAMWKNKTGRLHKPE